MKQNSNTNNNTSTTPAQQTSDTTGKKSRTILLIAMIVIVIAVIVVVIALVSYFGFKSPSAIIQNRSANSTATYLSTTQAQNILGEQQLSSYNTSDLFNENAFINATFMVDLVPQLYGNLTSGWVTMASGSNTNTNSSIIYVVMATNSPASNARSLGSALSFFTNGTTPISINPGTLNGFNYTYGAYSNSSVEFQIVYGWKNNDVAFALVQENPGYTVNQTALIDTIAKVTP
jgi:hypothetical protein